MPVAVTLVLAAGGAPASAGTYTIDQCRDAVTNSAKRVSADWSAQGPTKYDSCASGGAFGYHLPGGYIPYGTDYWLHLTAPASLPEVSIERLQLHYRIPSHSGNLAFFEVRNGGSVRYGEQLPADHTSSPIDVGMVAGARQVSLRHFCSTAYGGVNCNYTSSSEVLRITKARLTLREDTQPTATIDGGTLTQAGGRRGTETFTYSAGDNASGVERVRVRLGTTEVAQADFSGGCPRDDWAACQRTRNAQTLNVDTTQVADGSYPLTLEVTDAAANTRTVSGGTVVVDNVPPPSASSQPTVSGTARVGRSLTGTRGTWSGAGNTYEEQWERCETAEATSCSAITGASGPTYTATQNDAGRRLRLTVTATNGEGSTQASSAMTDAVINVPPPASTQPPSISGTARVGRTLTGDRGDWSSQTEVSYTQQWQRCTSEELASCNAIAGADALTYSATHDDVGRYLRLRVVATNDEGPAPAWSAPTVAVVYIPPPGNTQPPTVSGTSRVGRTLTGDRGEWSPETEVAFEYAWQRCDAEGGNCAAIDDADALVYVATHDDVGMRLRLRVTATNDEGTSTASSAATDAVVYIPPPANTQPPTVSGTARVGRTLTGDRGQWDSETEAAYTYRWLRCDGDDLASCAAIDGADQLTYSAHHADVGKRLRLRVVATNDEGPTTAHSAESATVVYVPPPQNTEPPSVSGEPRVGRQLTGDRGSWSSQTDVTYSHLWERCENEDPATCSAIAGATDLSYSVRQADTGKRLRLVVTAENDEGRTVARSAPTAAAFHIPPPHNSARPEVGGDPRARRTLTATRGSWDSQTDATYAEQWLRCDQDGAACEPIDGAMALTYTATGDDIGRRLRIRVTATNDEGTTTEQSDASPVIADVPAPQNTAPPTVSGEPRVGNRLIASTGDWSADADTSYAYRWERCESAAGATCTAIEGADAEAYDITAADVDRRLRVTVTATSIDGSTAASSATTAAVERLAAPSEPSGTPADPPPAEGRDDSGPANGRGASRRAVVTAAGRNAQRLVRVSYGRTVQLSGTLTDEGGRPIAGARLDVLSTRAGGAPETLGTATTDQHGRYGYTLPAGPSRTIRFAYRAFERDADYADSEDVAVRITPTVTLRATRRAASPGERIRFSGRVAASESRGLALTLERKIGRLWRMCARGRSRAGGAFRLTCRATNSGGQAYRLRVKPTTELDAGRSNIVRIRVGGTRP